jgi:cell division protease FtsH
VAPEIDKEVRKIINECLEEARRVITENKKLLDTISDYLIKVETLTKADIDEIVETGRLRRYDDMQSVSQTLTSNEA